MKKIIAATIMALSLFSTASIAKEIRNAEMKYSIIKVANKERSIIGAGTIYLSSSKNDGEFAQAEVSAGRNVAYTSSCKVSKIEVKKETLTKNDCDIKFVNEGYSLSATVKMTDDNLFTSSFKVGLSHIIALNQVKFPDDEGATPEEIAENNQKVTLPETSALRTSFDAINKPGVTYSYVIGNERLTAENPLGSGKNKEQKVQYLVEVTIS